MPACSLRLVGRSAARSITLVVAMLLLGGLVTRAAVTFANTAAAVVESFGAANASTGSAALAASPSTPTGAGDLLVALIRTRNVTALATVSSVTDSAADHWTLATSKTQGTAGDEEIWYAAGAASLSTSQNVTVTVGGTAAASSAIAVTVLDVTGAGPAPLDRVASNRGSTQPASTGITLPTTQANEIAIGDLGWNSSTVSVSGQTAGYSVLPIQTSTARRNATAEQGAWQLLTATGAQSYAATLSSSTVPWTGAIATFATGTAATPTVSGFTPASGPIGTLVTITGTSFSGTSQVSFGTTAAASFHVTSATQITATVASGTSTGLITVTTPGGPGSSASDFTVTTPPAPTITGFSPQSGPVGTPVSINGSNFLSANQVTFGGTSARFTVTDDSDISATVPSGAATGSIAITTSAGSGSSTTNFTVTAAPPAPHIMLIMEENHSYHGTGGVIGSPQAPYITTLAQTYLSATSWYAPYHGSPKDYMALLAGNTAGSLTPGKQSPDPTLVDELTSKGISWGAYFEAMPTSCDTSNYPVGSNAMTALYPPDHNPFLFYTSTRTATACLNNVPVAAPASIPDPPNDPFAQVMSSTSLPDFMFVAPDNCNEMHSECPAGGNNEVSNGNAWLANNIPAIQASPWYQQGGVVIITWDEGYHTDSSGWSGGAVCSTCGGGNIPTIVLSAANKTLTNHN
ncbi:MAG TPA: IPT/TIG domain-containing protein, partial [Mycobacteriales bacterium]|nr:IPT/TIG domain-containing protein [Mycobacteriales bacterium]